MVGEIPYANGDMFNTKKMLHYRKSQIFLRFAHAVLHSFLVKSRLKLYGFCCPAVKSKVLQGTFFTIELVFKGCIPLQALANFFDDQTIIGLLIVS